MLFFGLSWRSCGVFAALGADARLLALVLPVPKLLQEGRVLDGVGRCVDLGETEDPHPLLVKPPTAPVFPLAHFHLVDFDDFPLAPSFNRPSARSLTIFLHIASCSLAMYFLTVR